MLVTAPSLATKWKRCLLAAAVTSVVGGCTMPAMKMPVTKMPAIKSSSANQTMMTAADHTASSTRPEPTSSIVAQPSPSITQVGFVDTITNRQSGCVACGDAACVDGGCGNTSPSDCGVPMGYQPVPMAYQPYGIDPQEFLCDGGDQGARAYLRQDDTIAALEPEDTVVHFTNEAGGIEFAQSNRVCVYSPRFAAVRRITGAVAGDYVVAASGIEQPVGPIRIDMDQPGLVVSENVELGNAETARRIDAMRDRNRGVRVEGVLQPIQADEILAALANIRIAELTEIREADLALLEEAATAAIAWSIEESVEAAVQDLAPPVLTRDQVARGFTTYDFGDGRLVIGKFADKAHAQPGDVVAFALRVENVGDGPVNHVTITDNLTTRLEYIDGSQESSCEAEFEQIENNVESSQLVWTLKEELKVGESATLKFKCRVR